MSDWPRLSDQRSADRHTCAECGKCDRLSTEVLNVSIWQEHDDADLPTHWYVALCEPCAKRIIKTHPRLYTPMDKNGPMPGAMPTCDNCRWRDGTSCAHPGMMFNGGPGVALRMTEPTVCFIDVRDKAGKRFGRRILQYNGPVSCDGRQEVTT